MKYPHTYVTRALPKTFNGYVDWGEIIAFLLAAVIVGGFLFTVTGLPILMTEKEDEEAQRRPRLPAHVLAGPNNSFLVKRGYEKLGVVLCSDGEYTEHKLPNEAIISCNGRAEEFVYSKTRVWSP